MNHYWVYIVSSLSRVLYVGVTNELLRRMFEHKTGAVPGFTARYHVNRLVYCEPFSDIRAAIGWEKEIKRWKRERKMRLIESRNAGWADLSDSWGITT